MPELVRSYVKRRQPEEECNIQLMKGYLRFFLQESCGACDNDLFLVPDLHSGDHRFETCWGHQIPCRVKRVAFGNPVTGRVCGVWWVRGFGHVRTRAEAASCAGFDVGGLAGVWQVKLGCAWDCAAA